MNDTLSHFDLVAFVGMAAAIFTLVATAITLNIINTQVYLAREELKTVKEDVARNKELFERTNREPALWPYFAGYYTVAEVATEPFEKKASLSFKIYNLGKLPSLRYKLVVGFHGSFFPTGVGTVWEAGAEPKYEWKQLPILLDGDYRQFQFWQYSGEETIFIGDTMTFPDISITLDRNAKEAISKLFVIAKVFTEYGSNPSNDGEYLKLFSMKSWDQRITTLPTTDIYQNSGDIVGAYY